MKRIGILIVIISALGISFFDGNCQTANILSYEINPGEKELHFYWKNEIGENYRSIQNLKQQLQDQGKSLIFAMNGGMYNKDLSPQGLYIEKHSIKSPLDTLKKGYGNFYLHPNGVFYITTQDDPIICKTSDFVLHTNIKYATQSGPMLVINGKIHPKFNKGSSNVHIRNGVGILPNGNILFAMSKETINLHDFASFFKEHGCQNALYLDGFVSKTYLPSQKWQQLDGNFGVIIAEICENK